MKNYVPIILIALLSGITGAGVVSYFSDDAPMPMAANQTYHLASAHSSTGATVIEAPDFIYASSEATPAVVHIKSYVEAKSSSNGYDPLKDFFGNNFNWNFNSPGRQSAGSGVIISDDGFIATNNHVIKNADKVEVILNDKRTYVAEVVGTDPTTDLALLKIEDDGLPMLGYGNSDDVQVGEWVLAVGNPFNLTSTVTAGIVSAKGRSLNILDAQYKIESFIQTDAAVNPGNSGGALINNKGELIGINTAIASETGSFAGYSFAVPSNIVRKVMSDLREFGEVKRGLIGVQIQDIDAKFAEKNDLPILNGAYVAGVMPGGAAEDAGISRGDIITAVNGRPIRSSSQLQEVIGTYRPGDEIGVTVIRENNEKEIGIVLKGVDGSTDITSTAAVESMESKEILGAKVRGLNSQEKSRLGIENGVKVEKVDEGLLNYLGVEKGFVITKLNRQVVEDPNDLEKLLDEAGGRVTIEGIGEDGTRGFYSYNR